jgi:hypothetical protein
MDSAVMFGSVAALLGVIQYVPYIRDTWVGKTKPHAFSWFVWSVPTLIVFAAQLVSGGGAGSWTTGVSALMCTIIFIIALIYGERERTTLDYLLLGVSLIALFLWWLTSDPLLSVILVTAADVIGFGPTIRKSIQAPYEETAFTYWISGFKWICSLIALNEFSAINMTYPLAMIVANWGFVALLYYYRRIYDTHSVQ